MVCCCFNPIGYLALVCQGKEFPFHLLGLPFQLLVLLANPLELRQPLSVEDVLRGTEDNWLCDRSTDYRGVRGVLLLVVVMMML